jgi:hypothetical protein
MLTVVLALSAFFDFSSPLGGSTAEDKASGGTDMSATFAKYTSCTSCVADGWGWCPIKRRCGGFANKECGIGERFLAEKTTQRNGLWEPKEAVEPPAADVPQASPPPPATLLYAGPASSPATPTTVAVEPSGKSVDTEPTIGSLSEASNASAESTVVEGTATARAALEGLTREQLIQQIISMRAQMATSS